MLIRRSKLFLFKRKQNFKRAIALTEVGLYNHADLEIEPLQ